ncbi:MAG: DUF6754 domain-containing protein [Planctomycetota bacterium]
MPLMIFLVLIFFLIFPVCSVSAETPVSPTDVSYPTEFKVFDTPDDSNGNISLSWKAISGENNSILYVIYIGKNAEGPFDTELCRFPSTQKWKSDKEWPFWVSGKKEGYHYIEINPSDEFNKLKKKLGAVNNAIEQAKKDNKDYGELEIKKAALQKVTEIFNQDETLIEEAVYYFKVGVLYNNEVVAMTPVIGGHAKNNWFNFSRLNNFMVMIFFCGLVLWFISHAKKNQNLFLRRITGLDAVEEAVGRATEMGKSVFFLTGIDPMDSISTICATVVLGKISEKVAQYDSQIKIPHRDPIVMTVCQEIVKEAYTKAGRPDAYKEDSNFYVTADQFAYTATVNGMMMREKPAANFFMGAYMAEALLLTECGSATGAIQIAGSDSMDQLPFFITTCDYTLIGEEFYAASAYLSRQPVLVGTLKAQDIGKAFILTALVVGTTFATLYMPKILDLIKDFS